MKDFLQGLELILNESEGNVLQSEPTKELKHFLEPNFHENKFSVMQNKALTRALTLSGPHLNEHEVKFMWNISLKELLQGLEPILNENKVNVMQN